MSNGNNKALDSALAKVKDDLAKRDAANLEWMGQITTLDWKKLPPQMMAQIVAMKPFRGKKGEPDYQLTPQQAFVFCLRCYELGLSPLSGEAWFDPQRWTTNVTTEGQRSIAANRGVQTAPPSFERCEKIWPTLKPRPGLVVGPQDCDFGYTCRIPVWVSDHWFTAEYTAWISDWYRPTPLWNEQPEHMLQVRAEDKCLERVTGVGISAPITDEPPAPARKIAPIPVTKGTVFTAAEVPMDIPVDVGGYPGKQVPEDLMASYFKESAAEAEMRDMRKRQEEAASHNLQQKLRDSIKSVEVQKTNQSDDKGDNQ